MEDGTAVITLNGLRMNKVNEKAGKSYLKGFSNHVFNTLGLKGWRLEFWDASFCANDIKLISIGREDVDEQPWFYLKEMFLHEVAHIGETRPGSMKTHDEAFFKRLGELFIKFSAY